MLGHCGMYRGHTCEVSVCLCSGLCRFSPFHSLSVSSESSNCDFHCDARVKPAQNNTKHYQHCYFIVLQTCACFVTHFLLSRIAQHNSMYLEVHNVISWYDNKLSWGFSWFSSVFLVKYSTSTLKWALTSHTHISRSLGFITLIQFIQSTQIYYINQDILI
jgi:hypothetical protein